MDEAVEFALRAKAAGTTIFAARSGRAALVHHGAGGVPEVDDAITEMGEWRRRKPLLSAAP
jgi:hypothetical protein